jgi:hypothetical protein
VIKYYKLIIKNFDQVKKHNFDQVNFGQVIISPLKYKQVSGSVSVKKNLVRSKIPKFFLD